MTRLAKIFLLTFVLVATCSFHANGASPRLQAALRCKDHLPRKARQFCIAYLKGRRPDQGTITKSVTSFTTSSTVTTEVATPLAKRQEKLGLFFPYNVITDACLLYLYGTLHYPSQTTTLYTTSTTILTSTTTQTPIPTPNLPPPSLGYGPLNIQLQGTVQDGIQLDVKEGNMGADIKGIESIRSEDGRGAQFIVTNEKGESLENNGFQVGYLRYKTGARKGPRTPDRFLHALPSQVDPNLAIISVEALGTNDNAVPLYCTQYQLQAGAEEPDFYGPLGCSASGYSTFVQSTDGKSINLVKDENYCQASKACSTFADPLRWYTFIEQK